MFSQLRASVDGSAFIAATPARKVARWVVPLLE